MNNYISVYLSMCLHTHVYMFMYAGAHSKMYASIWWPEHRLECHSLDKVHIFLFKNNLLLSQNSSSELFWMVSGPQGSSAWTTMSSHGQWTLGFLCMNHQVQLMAYFTWVPEVKLWSSSYRRTTLLTEPSPEARLHILLLNHCVLIEHHRYHHGTLTLEQTAGLFGRRTSTV